MGMGKWAWRAARSLFASTGLPIHDIAIMFHG
jgi:hypothetical protein